MKTIISLDQSYRCTGYAVFNKETKELITYGKFTGGTLLGCKDRLAELLEKWEPELVLIESVQQQRNVNTFKLLAELLGVLKVCILEHGIEFEEVHVMRWRAKNNIHAKNRSEAKKMAQTLIQELYGVKPTQDECEAVLIGRYYFLSRVEF